MQVLGDSLMHRYCEEGGGSFHWWCVQSVDRAFGRALRRAIMTDARINVGMSVPVCLWFRCELHVDRAVLDSP